MDVESIEFPEMTVLKDEMIFHLIKNGEIIFKSQQIGEPDLTQEEKRTIAEACLLEKPGTFLSKFGKYLLEHHLNYFKNCKNNSYEVEYYLSEIEKRFSMRNKTTVRNRRLEAMKRLAIGGEYFTENEMRKRDPLLYEQLVGKFLTADEKKEKEAFTCSDDGEELKLSGLLLEQIERDIVKDLKTQQEQAEDDAMEEEDTDDEDKDPQDDRVLNLWGEEKSCRNVINSEDRKTQEEKKLLFEEFRSHMYTKFLSGNEQDFNYSEVDLNMEYDDLDQVERDEQEKYFEEDVSEEVVSDPIETISDSARALQLNTEPIAELESSNQLTTSSAGEIDQDC